jgi:myo-inositol 2-dehydrogenase/D-chiro-inositol 1-dehydrogenase
MTVRIVVLGTGRIGAMHAGMVARQLPGASLAGVFDVVAESATRVATDLGCPAADSLDEALSLDADAVAICTSTDTHIDVMIAAAEAEKAIFCEKPLSLDLETLDRGLAAVDAAGVGLQVGFNRRFDPSHKAVADAVAAGAVGDVHLCTITSRDPAPPPIDYIKVSGGIFCDMTIHDFDMARYVTGSEVVEVYAKGAVRVDPAIGEAGDIDTAVVTLTHANGAITTIDNSRRAVYGYDQRVEAFGSAGMVQSDNHHESTSRIATADGFVVPPLENFFLERYAQSYLDQWAAFVDMVANGSPSPASGADGRAPLVIGLAAWKSLRENRPIAIDSPTSPTSPTSLDS